MIVFDKDNYLTSVYLFTYIDRNKHGALINIQAPLYN